VRRNISRETPETQTRRLRSRLLATTNIQSLLHAKVIIWFVILKLI